MKYDDIPCPQCNGNATWCPACNGLGKIPIAVQEPEHSAWWLFTVAILLGGIVAWMILWGKP